MSAGEDRRPGFPAHPRFHAGLLRLRGELSSHLPDDFTLSLGGSPDAQGSAAAVDARRHSGPAHPSPFHNGHPGALPVSSGDFFRPFRAGDFKGLPQKPHSEGPSILRPGPGDRPDRVLGSGLQPFHLCQGLKGHPLLSGSVSAQFFTTIPPLLPGPFARFFQPAAPHCPIGPSRGMHLQPGEIGFESGGLFSADRISLSAPVHLFGQPGDRRLQRLGRDVLARPAFDPLCGRGVDSPQPGGARGPDSRRIFDLRSRRDSQPCLDRVECPRPVC